MPVPFILAGIAGIAGAAGLVKGGKAVSDNSKAKDLIKQAQTKYTKAEKELESQRKITSEDLDVLGEVKLNVWSKQMGKFVELFHHFKKVNVEGNVNTSNHLKTSETGNLKKMQVASIKATEIMKGGVASLGAGALAGVATYGGAMMFASASTGTAIATLSGAAATNATLAWFGGGSLAAGGMGMAGGTMVLGGIVAGPVLAAAGFIMAAKAEENLAKAEETYSEAKKVAEQMKTMTSVLRGISELSNSYKEFILNYTQKYLPVLIDLESVYQEAYKVQEHYFRNKIRKLFGMQIKIDYRKLTQKQQKTLHISWLMAQILYKVLAAPLLDKEGNIDGNAENILDEAKEAGNRISTEV